MIKFIRNYFRNLRRNSDNKFIYKTNLYYELFVKEKIYIKKRTYSQWGEDLAIYNFFSQINCQKIYVDIGAFHPSKYSNTKLLFDDGWRGYNFDINQYSVDLFKIARPHDQNRCIGISDRKYEKLVNLSYYIHEQNSLSEKPNKEIKNNLLKKKLIEISTLNDEVKESFSFLNIDAEGEDLKILQSIDFEKFKPLLICVEIFNESEKDKFFEILKKNGYSFYKNFNISYIFRK
jgi:hypothetical protein